VKLRTVFYVQDDWAFGSIHLELTKYLFDYNIDSLVLPWDRGYAFEEFAELNSVTDTFVTTLDGYGALLQFGVEPEKIVLISHGPSEFTNFLHSRIETEMYKLKGFGVVSNKLQRTAIKMGFSRVPAVTPLGINTNRFRSTMPVRELKTIGYAGIFSRTDPYSPVDCKRGHLAEECANRLNLEFKVAERYHNHFSTMAGFYSSVDCILIPSTVEGAGLPSLEAGAAGRLVIGTPAGHWIERVAEGGGLTASFDNFVEDAVEYLRFYQSNPSELQAKCEEIAAHAESYDWKYCAQAWAQIIKYGS
jgi:glycosyltransferase involved in cell wall biosynthesis